MRLPCLGRSVLTYEMIDFQRENKLGIELEAILTEGFEIVANGLKNYIDDSSILDQLSDRAISTKIENCIRKHVGLKTAVIFNTFTNGAIELFPLNRNHIFMNDIFRNQYFIPKESKILKEINSKKGFIDLKNAKLGGIFSEYEHNLYIDIIGLQQTYKITSAEATGILLHEIGHPFTWYETCYAIDETNQVLSNIAEELFSSKQIKNFKYIYAELEGKFDMKEKEIDDLMKNTRVIAGAKLFNKYIKKVYSQLDNLKYNQTASEQSADQFASRFGYAEQLASGLDKLMQYSTEKNTGTRISFFIFDFVMSLVLVSSLIATGYFLLMTLSPVLFLYFILFSVITTLNIIYGGTADSDMTYDHLKDRYIRIRQQLIASLKSIKNKSDKELSHILESINVLDKLIHETKSPANGVFTKISNLLFNKNKQAEDDILLQQLIEELSHNELFVKAAQLKTILPQA